MSFRRRMGVGYVGRVHRCLLFPPVDQSLLLPCTKPRHSVLTFPPVESPRRCWTKFSDGRNRNFLSDVDLSDPESGHKVVCTMVMVLCEGFAGSMVTNYMDSLAITI